MDSANETAPRRRILVIDDVESIHADYAKILGGGAASEEEASLQALDRLLFDDGSSASPTSRATSLHFELDHAMQGRDGLAMVKAAKEAGRPFSVAFVDMRMPPGWDGIETISQIWKVDADVQVVICTAYSDKRWEEIVECLGQSDRLLLLKKPFDTAEVYQLAAALSEKWIAQRQQRETLAGLEEAVARRTEELSQANRQLRLLNKELEVAAEEAHSAARAKGRFLATMSHEIRTTLNGILGAGHMLGQSELAPREKQFAEIITNSGETLMTIINDILDYSKFDAGQLMLESIPFSLRDLATDCASLLQSVVKANNVTLSLEIDERLPAALKGDPARMRQILLNLLNNAAKFGKNGPVKLAIKIESIVDAKARLRISIIDRGIGMKPETLDRLFTAFMQADTSTTRQFGGTGLGLAICKLLADAMDARIEVTSELGAGSTFALRLELPLADSGSVQKSADKPPSEDAARYPGMRVLLVDDNPINRKLARHFLRTMKLDVEFAENGQQAVERALDQSFDLVLMDLQMPVLDGYEATRIIRKSKAPGSAVPIVALTANAFSEVREECLSVGMNDFITKPLRMEDLKALMARWLGQVRS